MPISRSSTYYRTYEGGEVYYPFHYPYDGYIVPSRHMRQVISARMNALDGWNFVIAIGCLFGGWLSGHWWLAVSLFVGLWEVVQWYGTRRFRRRLRRVPLSFGLRVYALHMTTDSFWAVILVLPPVIATLVVLGLVRGDVTLLAWGGSLCAWYGTVLVMRFAHFSDARQSRNRIGRALPFPSPDPGHDQPESR